MIDVQTNKEENMDDIQTIVGSENVESLRFQYIIK